jgi:hypothetical protein
MGLSKLIVFIPRRKRLGYVKVIQIGSNNSFCFVFESALSCAIISGAPFKLIDIKSEVKTMLVNWTTDVEAALETARSENKPLLIDFSAAPA